MRVHQPLGGGAGGSASDSFTIEQCDAGDSPTADSSTDTIIRTSTDGSVLITGSAAGDSTDFTRAGLCQPSGTVASPTTVAAAGAITPVAGKPVQSIRIAGNGAARTAGSIAAGTIDGQLLTLIGCDDTNTLTVPQNATRVQQDGDCVLKKYSTITYEWLHGDSNWVERGRNDI